MHIGGFSVQDLNFLTPDTRNLSTDRQHANTPNQIVMAHFDQFKIPLLL